MTAARLILKQRQPGNWRARENTPHTARMAHDQALGKVMQHLLKDDTQVYKQFVENESFKRFVGDMVYALTNQDLERLGDRLISEITPKIVNQCQTDRLAAKAAPKTINDEVQLLLRLCGDQGDLIRAELRRKKSLKLKVAPSPGKPFSEEEQERMLAAALESTMSARLACDRQSHNEKAPGGDKQGGSPSIYPALVVALNCGMRDAEIRRLRWSQLDFTKPMLTVGKAKTDAGTGRTIPLNGTLLEALLDHAKWYVKRFGDKKPEWFVFPGGGRFPSNPAVGLTTLKTAWTAIRKKAKVDGRWHDTRHTLITELAESGAGDETIMEIAGHVSQQMLKRYSHIRTAAKRKALEDVERARAAAKETRVRAAVAQAEKDAAMMQEQVSNGNAVAQIYQPGLPSREGSSVRTT